MKKLTVASAATALVGALTLIPAQAQASVLQFADLDGAGAPTGTWVKLDKLNTMSSPAYYSAFSDLGVAGGSKTLDAGDTFKEKLSVVTNSSTLGLGNNNGTLNNDYRLEVTNTGTFYNVSGTAIVINADNSVTSDATSKFSVNFGASTIQLFNNFTNQLIANLIFQSGGGSNIQLVVDQFIGNITLNAKIDTANAPCGPGTNLCDSYIKGETGASVTKQEVAIISTGSATFLGFDGSDFATGILQTNFSDNGEANRFKVPEPASLGLLGLGLLGMGSLRRGKKSA
jgi:hypothetical protein